jgi:ATP/maltotriose-dependent transcriptional regulator MalT/DNA-binding SARP family transcriptional activator
MEGMEHDMEQTGKQPIPILKSKLIAPELADRALFTERLKALGIAGNRCTLITAPAGSGKTTAVLLSLAGVNAQVCWYRLEPEDSRHAIFAAHLVHTLFQKVPDQNRIQSPDMLSAMDDLSLFNAVLCQDAWECFGRNNVPIYLVLDNFHHAVRQPEIIECVRYMLSNMPPCVHLIITSRRQTGLEEGRALTEGIAAFGAAELRFTPDETRLFCREKFCVAADENANQRLHEISEGWIAGIVMILAVFKASGAAHLGSFLEKNLNSEELFGYLTRETLKHEDDGMVMILLKLALLEDFGAGELSGIFGITDSESYLNALAARNLYLTRTITGSGTVYRFHSLYKNALAAMARDIFGTSGLNELQVKIAGYYLASGEVDRAVRHYLAAGETDKAADVIGRCGDRMLNEGAVEALRTMVESFPETYREHHPYLLMYDGVTNKRIDFNRAIRCLDRARGLFKAAGNHAMRIKTCLFLMMACVYQNRLDILKEVAQELQTIPGAMEDELCRRSLMLLSLSEATLSENFQKGNAMFSVLRNMNLDQEERCGAYLYGCALRHRQGDLEGALKMLDTLFTSAIVKLDLYWRSFALSLRSRIFLLKGEFPEAGENVRELLELGERYAHHYSNANGRYYLAHIKYLTRDMDGAVRHICNAQRDYIAFENGVRANLCRLHHYLWVCGTGNSVTPSQILDVYNELITMNPGQGDDDLAASLAGAALRESGEYEQAERLLLHSLAKSTEKNATQSIAGTALHLAKLYFDMCCPEKGMVYLRKFFLICVENDYSVFYDMHFPTLVAMCARAVQAGIQTNFLGSVIRKYFGASAEKHLVKHADTLHSSCAVRKFLHKFSHTGKQLLSKDIYVELFGGFRITADGATLDESAFKTRKISGIIKYLLLNKDHYISRETLAAVFWPDSEKKAALNSLRVALCEVRKALSGIGVSFEDASPLITEEERGFAVSKNCKTDTALFIKLFQTSKTGDAEGKRAALFAMIDLYRDGLLPLDIYDDYTAMDREYFSALFFEAAHNAATLLMRESDFKAAETLLLRIIKLDSYNEHAYKTLIRLYRQTGQNQLADSVSKQFKKRYAKEMR